MNTSTSTSASIHPSGHWQGRALRPVPALLAGAAVAGVTAVLDLTAPATLAGNRASTVSDYAFVALLIPFALAAAWAVAAMDAWHGGRDGQLGRWGSRSVTVGAGGFVVAALATLVTGNDRAIAPVYPSAMLLSLIGFVLVAIAWTRVRALPVWAGPALAVAWLVGGPVAPGHGLFLVLAAVYLAMAAQVSKRGRGGR